MKYDVTEMAFDRPCIIRSLENYNMRIFEHAVKIIVLPESRDVSHWKQEILAWVGYLASLRLVRTKKKSVRPMGADLAFRYLYRGPFEGNEMGMTAHFIRMVEVSHRIRLDVDTSVVFERLKIFLTQLSEAIGSGGDVEPIVESL